MTTARHDTASPAHDRIDAVLAVDLGTGGCKASLWDDEGRLLEETFHGYATTHPHPGWNEQLVDDWREAVVRCTRDLVARRSDARVLGIAVSGHSLGILLLDAHGEPVERTTPIWSDSRATVEAGEVFADLDEDEWYLRTGNGFTPPLYPVFKARWYAKHRPDTWDATTTIIGCKDWINLWMTGELATDHSYASGSGVYDLSAGRYADEYLAAGGIARGQLPEPRMSHDEVGRLRASAAGALGLQPGIPVFTGAVDNAAMALGSRGVANGRIYASLGSSSWMTVTADHPVLDVRLRPYVFAHVMPGYFASAMSTFSSGTSITWLHDRLDPERSLTALLDEGAAVEAGTGVPVFIPTLGGGTPLEGGSEVRGVLAGLDLAHERAHIARAGMEGIAFCLERSLRAIRALVPADEELLISGGGARHHGWNQIYADIIGQPLVRTAVDQQAAALGAAAIALVGLGVWSDFSAAERPHIVRHTYVPDPGSAVAYAERRHRFTVLQQLLADTGGTFDTTSWSRP